MSQEIDPVSYPIVHVLVSDPFFWEKVEGTLRALEKRPLSPDWERDVFEQVVVDPGVGMVLDLEDDRFDALGLLRKLHAHDSTQGVPVLAYCSHLRHDLIQAARELGAEVVPRSTFAANLVRLLMDLAGPAESADQGRNT